MPGGALMRGVQNTARPARSARYTVGAWLVVAIYFTATSLGHLEFTRWLIAPRLLLGVSYAFKDLVPALLLVAVVCGVAWHLSEMAQHADAWRARFAYWLFWGLSVAAVDRFLTYSIYEYAHYPQYALLAVLVARASDPLRRNGAVRVAGITTLLGVADEWMQYLWITPSYGHYLDFNDFLVNQLAAFAGVLLYYAPHVPPARETVVPRMRRVAAACFACGLLVGVAMSSGLLAYAPAPGQVVPPGGWMTAPDGGKTFYLQRAVGWYGSWQAGPHRGSYFVMPPWAALAAMLAIAWVLRAYAVQLGDMRMAGEAGEKSTQPGTLGAA